ncbi:formate dehydrogenase (NAD+) [Scheffersomyces spartinae]|uniref:Formate dehydrogenase n=1 Tax=Scheffersomyces spartinae TaxID=45513 RepID=A0A9P7V9M0_9ASCO|nr:formate dehydrogenase (NAD+) [Scheffersomyces spartinae]KAG7193580.1 formate dehydrogenase (NAD+) [Scheffersomyces spartinae]
MAKKILLVLYDGKHHAKEQPLMLGCVENELGIRQFVENHGYELVTTSNKDGADSVVDQNLKDVEIIISTPFFPVYVTKERMDQAPDLKLCITAGVGSDHVDLDEANKRKIGVLEVTGSNVVSVAECVLETMLVLVRNFVPAHNLAMKGDWDIAQAAKMEFDLEDKVIATVGAGRIGYRVLERLVAFNPKKLYYYDYQDLAKEQVDRLNQVSMLLNGRGDIVERVTSLEDMVSRSDIVTINCPLHENTKGLFNKNLISKMKDGAYIVNTARGAIVVAQDVADALASGKLAGYGGDVWFPQPPPKDHPFITMRNKFGGGNAMTPHISGTSLDAQKRYCDGVKDILESYFTGKNDYRPQDVIVIDGHYATRSYGDKK